MISVTCWCPVCEKSVAATMTTSIIGEHLNPGHCPTCGQPLTAPNESTLELDRHDGPFKRY